MAKYAIITLFLCVQVIQAFDKACPYKAADLVFVLDGSGSEGQNNFRKQLEFVSNFTNQFEIGPNNTRVALLTFSTAVHNQFFLNQFNDIDNATVLQAINSTRYPDGETNTHLALNFVKFDTLTAKHGGDRNVSKVVIVLTDGQSLVPTQTAQAATNLKKDPLVTVMAIGIGSRVDPGELRAIASDSNHTFQVSSFDALHTIQTELTQETCNVCKNDRSDICFILDSSGSEGSNNFQHQLDFVDLVVNEFEINGQDATRICVITFGTIARTEIRLNQYSTKEAIIQQIPNIPYRDGETMTDQGLYRAYNEYFHHDHHNPNRPNANKVAIVLTDGRSTEPDNTRKAADRLHKKGVETFTIGIGSHVDSAELNTIASDRDHVFRVQRFDQLDSIHQAITDKICAKSALLTTTTTTTTPVPTTSTTTLPPTTTKAACGLKPADIVFVLDSSDSEGADNFKKEVEFVNSFAAQFSIGASNVQFSSVTFSSAARNDFYFNTYHTRNEVLHAIRNIAYIGQGTNTSGALAHVRENNLQSQHGARANSQKYVIVITDGRSDDSDATKHEATQLQKMATVIAIGIGPKVDQHELNAIDSNRHAVLVSSFELLQGIKQQLTDSACGH